MAFDQGLHHLVDRDPDEEGAIHRIDHLQARAGSRPTVRRSWTSPPRRSPGRWRSPGASLMARPAAAWPSRRRPGSCSSRCRVHDARHVLRAAPPRRWRRPLTTICWNCSGVCRRLLPGDHGVQRAAGPPETAASRSGPPPPGRPAPSAHRAGDVVGGQAVAAAACSGSTCGVAVPGRRRSAGLRTTPVMRLTRSAELGFRQQSPMSLVVMPRSVSRRRACADHQEASLGLLHVTRQPAAPHSAAGARQGRKLQLVLNTCT